MFHVCDDKLYVLRCYVILSRVTRDRRDTGPVTLGEVIQSMRNVLIVTSYCDLACYYHYYTKCDSFVTFDDDCDDITPATGLCQ